MVCVVRVWLVLVAAVLLSCAEGRLLRRARGRDEAMIGVVEGSRETRTYEAVASVEWEALGDGSILVRVAWGNKTEEEEEVVALQPVRDIFAGELEVEGTSTYRVENSTEGTFAVVTVEPDNTISGLFARADGRLVMLHHANKVASKLGEENVDLIVRRDLAGVRPEYMATVSATSARRSLSSCDGKPRRMSVTMVMDTEYINHHGSVTRANAEVQSIVAQASSVLEATFNVQLEISSLLRPSEKQLSSCTKQGSQLVKKCGAQPEDMLCGLHSYGAKLKASEKGAIVHLMTGCKYSQATGFAYINKVCDAEYNVGFTSAAALYDWEVFLHEVGHNLGAEHPSAMRSTGGVMDNALFGSRGHRYLPGTTQVGFTASSQNKICSTIRNLDQKCSKGQVTSLEVTKASPSSACGDSRCCKKNTFLVNKVCGSDGACVDGSCYDPCSRFYGFRSCKKLTNGGCLLSCESDSQKCTNSISRMFQGKSTKMGAMPDGTACKLSNKKFGVCSNGECQKT